MRKLRIIIAIAVAIGSCLFSPRDSWPRITGTSRLFWNWLTGRIHWADPYTAASRYARCEKCPIFYKPLRTCGSPLDKELRGLGCHCSIPIKARLREATCWGDDNLGDEFVFGWKAVAKSGRV